MVFIVLFICFDAFFAGFDIATQQYGHGAFMAGITLSMLFLLKLEIDDLKLALKTEQIVAKSWEQRRKR